MTPHDETLTGETAAFVAALRASAHGAAPEASAELHALFSSMPVVTAPPATTTPRRTPVSDAKRLLTAIPSKIAAGVLGALLAGSLGAGAMTGTITLTSNESDVPESTEVLADDETLEDDEELVDQEAEVEEVEVEAVEEEAGDDEPKAAVDPMVPPTSVSEAAQNHHFDEACGNHGAYVSHFARTGEEPECAVAARAALAGEAPADELTTEAAEAETESEVTGPGKSDQGKAKAAAAKAKATERKSAGGKGKASR